MIPTVGRIVQYQLAEYDVETIDRTIPRVVENSVRRNPVHAGQILPALIVAAWGTTCVNLQVFLDGAGSYWATSRSEGEGAAQWQWPHLVNVAKENDQ